MGTTIGVDVGGTSLRAARFDDDATMLERVQCESHAEQGSDAVIERLIGLIRQMLPEDPDDLAGVGIGVPGKVDAVQGLVIDTPNLPWRDVPLTEIVQQAIGCAAHLGNDANLAGLAEHRLGAGVGSEHMIYMTISTGIGGGLISGGQLITGRGLGGEAGHIIIDRNGPPCSCGSPGHLSAFASGTAIARTAHERLYAGVKSGILDLVDGSIEKVTAKEVGQAALDGDTLAVEIVQEAGGYIGIGIATLMHLFNPDMFVLGGGVTKIGDLLLEAIRESARANVMHPRYAENTLIVPARLEKDAGLIGAALFVKVHAHETSRSRAGD